jgi:glutathione peroxidase
MAELARRGMLAAMVAALAGRAEGRTMEQLAWGFTFPDIEGGTLDFAAHKGRVLLVVNTASFCGYTGQYEGLQQLHEARGKDGLVVIGIPSQDFNQEAASEAEVKRFCETRFGIDFPMTAILKVRGPAAHPFYRWVKGARGWEPGWNFNKVLVGRDGRVAGVFGASDAPGGTRLSAAIAAALG